MAKNPADLLARGTEPLLENLRRALSQLHERLAEAETTLGDLRTGQSQAIDSLVTQITNNFSPLLTEAHGLVEAIRDGDFITAEVLTPAVFMDGVTQTLTLAESPTFPFRPTDTLLLRRRSSSADYAFVRLDGWKVEQRELRCTVFMATGAPGPHDDVTVEIAALSTLAQSDMLAQAIAAKMLTISARNEAVRAAEDTLAAAILIADGPVSTINGKGGVVDLRAHEVPLEDGEASVQVALEALAGRAGNLESFVEAKADRETMEAGEDDEHYATSAGVKQSIIANASGYQEFLSSGTCFIPPWAKWVYVEVLSGGAGGGSGRRGAVSTNKTGGGGGSGGVRITHLFNAADLPSSVPVLVGAAGLGGAAVTTDDTDGNPGTDGGNSSFGSLVANGGKAGNGGVSAGSATGGAGPGWGSLEASNIPTAFEGSTTNGSGNALFGAGAGGTGSTNGTNAPGKSSLFSGTGGGGGGGEVGTSNTLGPAGAGGSHASMVRGGGAAAGVSHASAPTAGADAVNAMDGGGGGGSSQTAPGAKGGKGGRGAGGGGGGSSRDGFASGAGGNGGGGRVRVWWG